MSFVAKKIPLNKSTLLLHCKRKSLSQWLHAVRHQSVKVGCASGFWGDTTQSSGQLIHQGKVDFLVSDYLSEITMSIMTAQKKKNSAFGYVPDFVQFAVGPQLKAIAKKGTKVLSNAGGTNPEACAEALEQFAKKLGVKLNIAVVTGDDMMPLLQNQTLSSDVKEMFNGNALPHNVSSMNAYFGAEPLRVALDKGADVVITGRCTDSALILAPLMHSFDWSVKDFDRLAAGSLAGHLLECGAQSTGGFFTDWHTIDGWDNIGFPIAECFPDGKFNITKAPGTGGLVSVPTVAEQMLYEIGDPQAYLLPDVSCDFSNVQMEEIAPNVVQVTGAKGYAPSDQFKVSATYADGYRLNIFFLVGGKNAIPKGLKATEATLKRIRSLYKKMGIADVTRVHLHAVGDESMYGRHARSDVNPRESAIWCSVEHQDKKALGIMAMEFAGMGTGTCPGVYGFVGGRPKPSPIFKLFSFLYPKSDVPSAIHMGGETTPHIHYLPSEEEKSTPEPHHVEETTLETGSNSLVLEDLAYARSGDKGNSANIGVIARHPDLLPFIRKALTPAAVHYYFEHFFEEGASVDSSVQRYEVPGIHGFNFYLRDSLGGGGVSSLRPDPQGKSYAQLLLDFEVNDLPDSVVDLVKSLKD